MAGKKCFENFTEQEIEEKRLSKLVLLIVYFYCQIKSLYSLRGVQKTSLVDFLYITKGHCITNSIAMAEIIAL